MLRTGYKDGGTLERDQEQANINEAWGIINTPPKYDDPNTI